METLTSRPKSLLVQDENDVFYFESDHLALKGNKDYGEMLKTILILEAQQARAIKDYDEVIELHKKALENPQLLLDKLKNGESVGVPDLQVITEIPTIDWSKYDLKIPAEGLKFLNEKSDKNILKRESPAQKHKTKNILDTTYNQPWTTEEQRRLEDLLIVYPPESIELRRFKKIAAALGNRTVQQVSSRIQKYFIKLYKAGLPIPGRIPKYAERWKKSKLHMHQKNNHYLFKPTTFFPQFDLPVVMDESEDIPGPSISSAPTSNNYLISGTFPEDGVEELIEGPKDELKLQIELLKRVKCEKQTANNFQCTFQHLGFKCDYCDEEPIVGTRWHCITCNEHSIDFCSDCVISQMYSGNSHPLTHKLQAVRYEDNDTLVNDSTSDSSMSSDSEKRPESSDEESANNTDNEETEQNDEKQTTDGYELSNATVNTFRNIDQVVSDENVKMEIDTQWENTNVKLDTDLDGQDEFNNDMFTETQDITYSYLHSHLLKLDNDIL